VPNVKAQGSTLFNPGWHASQDIRYLTQISEIILRAALERKERRGAQWRLDYDGPSDELGKINFIVTKGEQGEIDIERREITPMPEHLSRLFEEEGDAQVSDEHGGEEEGKESQF
jgi:succinate dehydrogenase / fumarate reductase, flavoprotein subunit